MMRHLKFFCPYRWVYILPILLYLLMFDAAAQSREKLEEQRKQTLLEIEEISSILAETQKSKTKSLATYNLLNAKVIQISRLINSIDAEIADANRQIGETTAKIEQMSNEIEKMKAEYAQMIFHAYKNRGQYNKLIYVLSAKDFNEAYRRMKYFQQYSEYRKKQVAEIKEKQEELRVVIEQLEVQKSEKEKLLAEQYQESKRLEVAKTAQNSEVSSLKSQERRIKSQLDAQERKARRLDDEIKKIIAAEAKKLNTTSSNIYDALTPEQRLISNNFKGNKGRLPWPTEKGSITGFFGLYTNPFNRNLKRENDGIYITTVEGADVRVVFDGEVTAIGGVPGDNMYVLVRHGSYITVYQNLVNVKVKQGAKVKSKDIIGKVYTEKGATSAVLYFQVWEENKKQNPELWLAKK